MNHPAYEMYATDHQWVVHWRWKDGPRDWKPVNYRGTEKEALQRMTELEREDRAAGAKMIFAVEPRGKRP